MKQSGLGIASFVIGIVGFLFSFIALGILPCFIGLIFSVIGICAKDRKKGLSVAGFVLCVLGIMFSLLFAPIVGEKSKNTKKVGEVQNENGNKSEKEEAFRVGDVVETSNLRITFVSAKKYKEENEFSQPKKGNMYYRMQFEFENIGNSDETISSLSDWDCYADGYAVEQYFGGEDEMDASISTGKKIRGSVYFEVPKDAKSITLEYKTNIFTNDKIEFIAK